MRKPVRMAVAVRTPVPPRTPRCPHLRSLVRTTRRPLGLGRSRLTRLRKPHPKRRLRNRSLARRRPRTEMTGLHRPSLGVLAVEPGRLLKSSGEPSKSWKPLSVGNLRPDPTRTRPPRLRRRRRRSGRTGKRSPAAPRLKPDRSPEDLSHWRLSRAARKGPPPNPESPRRLIPRDLVRAAPPRDPARAREVPVSGCLSRHRKEPPLLLPPVPRNLPELRRWGRVQWTEGVPCRRREIFV